jgi:GNAT superfamily N-acetyltransferase
LPITIRPYEDRDAAAVSDLFASYMREVYGEPNTMTPHALQQAVGRHFELLLVADRADRPVGFAAWRETYDLHNAVAGVEVPDLFIDRAFRGRAAAVRLVAALAGVVLERGGAFIRGDLVLGGNDARRRLAQRMTVGFPGEAVYLAGTGLRKLASLANTRAVDLLRQLPTPDDSREP